MRQYKQQAARITCYIYLANKQYNRLLVFSRSHLPYSSSAAPPQQMTRSLHRLSRALERSAASLNPVPSRFLVALRLWVTLFGRLSGYIERFLAKTLVAWLTILGSWWLIDTSTTTTVLCCDNEKAHSSSSRAPPRNDDNDATASLSRARLACARNHRSIVHFDR